MREIRFRLWNPEEECFTCPQNIEDDIFANPVVHPSGTGQFLLDSHCDLFILEEYTGLKDKNVWEGDRITFTPSDLSTTIPQEAVVEYCEKRACFIANSDAWLIPLHECRNIKVIGNIHENPELLTNNQK